MKLIISIVLIGSWVLFLPEINAATNKVVCYYGSWAVYRPGAGKFDVEQIDPKLCTHLIYSFVGIGNDGSIIVNDPWNDLQDNGGRGGYKRFVNLKQKSPSVKTMVAIGGWDQGSQTFSNVMADKGLLENFVNNAVAFLRKYGFDGLDIDWEYPAQRGGQPHDKQNFVNLIQKLRAQFDKYGFLLTAAVGATESDIQLSYDVPKMSKHLDWINVMTYDLHGPWDGETGQNAPLNPSSKDKTALQKQLNVKACIQAWIKHGAKPAKLVLGMGEYGRSFTLNDPSNTGLGSPSNKPGNAGPYTDQAGMLGYNEIVETQNKGGWTIVWDDVQKVPYMYKTNQWVGYDNPTSITAKVDYAKQLGLGGGMVWSIDTDDFNGASGTKFPILRSINSGIGRK